MISEIQIATAKHLTKELNRNKICYFTLSGSTSALLVKIRGLMRSWSVKFETKMLVYYRYETENGEAQFQILMHQMTLS